MGFRKIDSTTGDEAFAVPNHFSLQCSGITTMQLFVSNAETVTEAQDKALWTEVGVVDGANGWDPVGQGSAFVIKDFEYRFLKITCLDWSAQAVYVNSK